MVGTENLIRLLLSSGGPKNAVLGIEAFEKRVVGTCETSVATLTPTTIRVAREGQLCRNTFELSDARLPIVRESLAHDLGVALNVFGLIDRLNFTRGRAALGGLALGHARRGLGGTASEQQDQSDAMNEPHAQSVHTRPPNFTPWSLNSRLRRKRRRTPLPPRPSP